MNAHQAIPSPTLRRALVFAVVAWIWLASPSPAADERPRPSVQAMESIQAAADLLDAGKFAAAETMTLNALRERATEATDATFLSLTLAQIYLSADKLAEAVEPLESALSSRLLDPAMEEGALRGLGQVLFHLERKEEAVAAFDRLLPSLPDVSAPTLQLYAVLLLQAERPADALAQCQRAMLLERKLDRVLLQIAVSALQSLGRETDAARYLEYLLKGAGDDTQLWDELVAAYYRSGDYWGAVAALERAQARGFKTDLQSRITRLELLYELEQYHVAAKEIEAGLASGDVPSELRVWLMLVYCYEQQDMEEKAVLALEAASKASPWSEIDLRLADKHWRASDFRAALDDVKRALGKGSVQKPGEAWVLAAAAAIALQDLPESEAAVAHARENGVAEERLVPLEEALVRLRNIRLAESGAAPAPAGQTQNTRS